MVKNVLILILIAVAMLGCDSDDDDSRSTPISTSTPLPDETILLLEDAVDEDIGVVTIEYDQTGATITPPSTGVIPIQTQFRLSGITDLNFSSDDLLLSINDIDVQVVGDSNNDNIPDYETFRLYKKIQFDESEQWIDVGNLRAFGRTPSLEKYYVTFSLISTQDPNGDYFVGTDASVEADVVAEAVSSEITTARNTAKCSLVTNTIDLINIVNANSSSTVNLVKDGSYECFSTLAQNTVYINGWLSNEFGITVDEYFTSTENALIDLSEVGLKETLPMDIVIRITDGIIRNTEGVYGGDGYMVSLDRVAANTNFQGIVYHEMFHLAHHRLLASTMSEVDTINTYNSTPNWLSESLPEWFMKDNLPNSGESYSDTSSILERTGLWVTDDTLIANNENVEYGNWQFFDLALECLASKGVSRDVAVPTLLRNVNGASPVSAFIQYMSSSQCPVEELMADYNKMNLPTNTLGNRMLAQNKQMQQADGWCSEYLFDRTYDVSNLVEIQAGGAVTIKIKPLTDLVIEDDIDSIIFELGQVYPDIIIVVDDESSKKTSSTSSIVLDKTQEGDVFITMVNMNANAPVTVTPVLKQLVDTLVFSSNLSLKTVPLTITGRWRNTAETPSNWNPFQCDLDWLATFAEPILKISDRGNSVVFEASYENEVQTSNTGFGCFNFVFPAREFITGLSGSCSVMSWSQMGTTGIERIDIDTQDDGITINGSFTSTYTLEQTDTNGDIMVESTQVANPEGAFVFTKKNK